MTPAAVGETLPAMVQHGRPNPVLTNSERERFRFRFPFRAEWAGPASMLAHAATHAAIQSLRAMPEPRRADTGHRIGEYHHRAILADADVREIRDLHEFRKLTAKTIRELLAERDPPVRVSYHTVRSIIAYRRRVHP